MAQINITLEQEEILHIFTANRDEAFKILLEKILNEVMKAESEEQIGAELHERSGNRKDYRNGSRERQLTTRIGTLNLEVPRHRKEPFHTMVLENYRRSEASLIATMVQMVIAGVSTRKVAKVVETLCGQSFSKSTVSALCKTLDAEIDAFRTRPLDYLSSPFLMVDATYFSVREDSHIVKKAFMLALAIREDGMREIVGFDVFDAEDEYSWRTFLNGLKERGLKAVNMMISDAHKSIRKAMAAVFPETAWQRCQTHFTRNILDETPNKYRKGLALELRKMFEADTVDEARKVRDELIDDYSDVASKAMKVLDEGFEDSMTVMLLPKHFRVSLRSTNILERLNRELKRRSNVIQVFPNRDSVLRLMGAVSMEQNEAFSCKQRLFSPKTYCSFVLNIFPQMFNVASQQLIMLNAY